MLLEAGRKLYAERKFDAALAQFEQAHSACAQPKTTLLPLAQAQLMAQKLEASIRSLEEFLAVQPRSVEALKLKGDVLYLLGRETEAVAAVEAVLATDPAHSGALYALARMRYQQNRFPEAVDLLQKIIAREPDHYRAHDNLALSYAAQQQDALAIKHFVRALDLVHKAHPEYDTVYANAANFFLERGEFQKAFQLGAEAAKRNPGYARNFFLTGKALVKLEKHELSVRWFQQAAQLDPSYKEPHYWLGTVYRKLGRTDEAARSLERFRDLSKAPAVTR
ncbi:MAG TPA: tetratricopeptide repeat protein [Bryobacteraceae bacterium]|nr:tetratricopeptide repeat protein [Bryobacteraceae bacterium]